MLANANRCRCMCIHTKWISSLFDTTSQLAHGTDISVILLHIILVGIVLTHYEMDYVGFTEHEIRLELVVNLLVY